MFEGEGTRSLEVMLRAVALLERTGKIRGDKYLSSQLRAITPFLWLGNFIFWVGFVPSYPLPDRTRGKALPKQPSHSKDIATSQPTPCTMEKDQILKGDFDNNLPIPENR